MKELPPGQQFIGYMEKGSLQSESCTPELHFVMKSAVQDILLVYPGQDPGLLELRLQLEIYEFEFLSIASTCLC